MKEGKEEMRFEKVSFTQWELDALKKGKYREWNFYKNLPEGFPSRFDVWNKIKLPKRATKFSAGHDFFMPITIKIQPGETITIPTGIKWNPGDQKDTYLSIFPRSSLGRDYSLREPNIVSIIDADYYGIESNEGHIFINLKNEGTNGAVIIHEGEAYAQGIINKYYVTDDDDVTTERTGGFGSTTRKVDNDGRERIRLHR
jgi:dUTP pyrophosphatase